VTKDGGARVQLEMIGVRCRRVSVIARRPTDDAQVANKALMAHQRRAPNKRLERTGTLAERSVEWLEGSMTKSLDQTVRQVGWSARRSSASR
jgi:hypothetical protein